MKQLLVGLGLLSLLLSTARGEDKKETSHKVGKGDSEITVVIDKTAQVGWTFTKFKDGEKVGDDRTIEGIAVYGGGSETVNYYCYDADGVKLNEGGLNYQDYPEGEKVKIRLLLGRDWKKVKKVVIKGKQ